MTHPAQRLGLVPPAPVDRKDLVPNNPGPRPEQLWVKVSDLRIDRAYQRQISRQGAARIRRMVEGWDWRLVQAITVAELPGGLWELIDGQHRAVAAATHGGIPLLPATVLPAGSARDSARAFVSINTQRVAITPGQKLKAAIAAGDDVAMNVWRAAEAAGVRLLFNPVPGDKPLQPCACMAASALVKLSRARGERGLRRILEVGAAADLALIGAEHLHAVDLLLHEPEFGGEDLSAEMVAAALRRWPEIAAAAERARAETGGTKARACAVELSRRIGRRAEAAA